MKKRVLSLLLALLTAWSLLTVTASAAITDLTPAAEASAQTGGEALEDWRYRLDENDGTIILTGYIGEAAAVSVPDSFEIDGQTRGTVLASGTVFRANTAIRSVTLSAGVRFMNGSMRLLFGECSSLTQADFSAVDTADVTNMSYMFYNCTALKSFVFPALDTAKVTTIRGLFSGCEALASVDLSSIDTSCVTDMSYIFYNCTALRTLDLSAFDTSKVDSIRAVFSGCKHLSRLTGYENWNTSSLENMSFAFNYVAYSVDASTQVCIDLSRWDLSHLTNNGWCFQMCRAQQIIVPDNIAVMSAGFVNHAIRYTGSTYTIPAGVKKIGYAHTFYDFATDDFTEFRVAEGNTAYQAIDGVLYSADGKEMLAVPRNKPYEGGVFEIPEGVDFLGELSFSRNYNIHTVILPDSYEIEYVPVYDDRYIVFEDTGNLNAGTNLSIAIYCYTGITDYAVKESNPRYASADGVIYSKDMSRVVAIPARYNREIVIPSGVKYWDREAMWADGSDTVDKLLANCPGVSLPATLTVMSEDQIEMLNRLHANRAGTGNPFTIKLEEGCTSFYLDENGYLVPDVFACHSLSLKGDICVNFYLSLTDEEVGKGAAVSFSWNVNGEQKSGTVDLTAADKTPQGYKAVCPLPAAEMSSEITAAVYVEDRGDKWYYDTYSALDYAQVILSDEYAASYTGSKPYAELKALVEAMLDYGARAQECFKTNTDQLANGGVYTTPDTVADEIPSCMIEMDASAYGLEYIRSTVVLLSETSIRHYYRIVDGDLFSAVSDSVTFNGAPATDIEKDEEIYFELKNIAAKDLDEPYTLRIGETDYPYAALDFVRTYLEQPAEDQSPAAKALVTAMYYYSQSANAYFDSEES